MGMSELYGDEYIVWGRVNCMGMSKLYEE